MIYQTTLVLEKDSSKNNKISINEIEKYVREKKGEIIDSKFVGEKQITLDKKRNAEASIYQIILELLPEEVSKIKKRIGQEKKVISFILEKGQITKPEKEDERKDKKKIKTKKTSKKESQANQVLDSMQEEEEKIKDLDSTLDELLNE